MELIEKFKKVYGDYDNIQTSFCPYRICPMGAHSDHQYGLITGLAIDKGITVVFVPTDDGSVKLNSLNFEGECNFVVGEVPQKQNDWADYLRGATLSLERHHHLKKGIYALIEGTLPVGGLSSSAAVIISYLAALCKVNSVKMSKQEIIETALWAENEYIGISCGKLDQSCEVYSQKDHLLFLDTKDDSYELIPQNPKMKPYEIAIFFSGVERTLVGSKFNVRVDELKATAYYLKGISGMDYGKLEDTRMRDVPREIFEKHKKSLPKNWVKRATHFYTEFERVQEGKKAWEDGDIERFGRLSFESGKSSIYNYETGSPELKALYDIMLDTKGIYGGRFSGAGFKGCCMALVDPKYKDSIKKEVTEKYLKEFPNLTGKFQVFFCKSADGCQF